MPVLRTGVLALGFVLAVLVQAVLLRPVAVYGVVPNLALLLVIAAAYLRGPDFAALMGLLGGLILDLTPPAGHVAGRWAIALVIAGYLAGRVREDAIRSWRTSLLVVAGCSFVATSLYVIAGAAVGDASLGGADTPAVLGISVVMDVVVSPLVIPLFVGALSRVGMAL